MAQYRVPGEGVREPLKPRVQAELDSVLSPATAPFRLAAVAEGDELRPDSQGDLFVSRHRCGSFVSSVFFIRPFFFHRPPLDNDS
jgi:hypothetical protein